MTRQQSVTDIISAIKSLSAEHHQLSAERQIPRSFLSVIQRNSRERIWNHLLSYFLDPSQPHGMNDALLRSFLQLLEEKFKYQVEVYPESRDIHVEEQPTTAEGRRLDLIIYEPQRWCVGLELKIHDAMDPSKLSAYAKSSKIGGCEIDNVENPLYLVVGKGKHRSALQDDDIPFRFLNWASLNEAVFQKHITHGYQGRSLLQPFHQLLEFSETIRQEVTRGGPKLDDRQRELCNLYLKHHSEIEEVTDAWEDFEDNWWVYFNDYCTLSGKGDRFIEGGERWKAYTTYGHIFKPEWWLNSEGQPEKDIHVAYRILFTHNLGAIQEGVLSWEGKCNTELGGLRRTAPFIEETEDINKKHAFDGGEREFQIDKFPDSYFEALLDCLLEFTGRYEEQIDPHMEQVKKELTAV